MTDPENLFSDPLPGLPEIPKPPVIEELAPIAPSFPKKESRLWKPEGSEFLLDSDFAQLVVELGETDPGVVMFDIQPEEQDGQPGHVLIASLIPNIS